MSRVPGKTPRFKTKGVSMWEKPEIVAVSNVTDAQSIVDG